MSFGFPSMVTFSSAGIAASFLPRHQELPVRFELCPPAGLRNGPTRPRLAVSMRL